MFFSQIHVDFRGVSKHLNDFSETAQISETAPIPAEKTGKSKAKESTKEKKSDEKGP